jgi:hypothetical protein
MKPILLVAMFGLASGCAWQNLPPPLSYQTAAALPLKVGITGHSAELQTIDALADEFKTLRLFESVTYPYRAGDPVDLVMDIRATLNADTSGSAWRGALVGATFFTLSPFLGPKVEYTTAATATFTTPEGRQVASVKAEDQFDVTFGLGADVNAVRQKSAQLLTQRLAAGLSQQIQAQRQTLLASRTRPAP